YRQALEMRQKLFPADKVFFHPDLAESLSNLGVLLHSQGEYGKAEPFLRRALQMRQALFPKGQFPNGHPDLALSLGNLRVSLEAQEDYTKAEPLYRQALEMQKQHAIRLAQTAPEPLALNYAATFPISRDGLLSITRHLPGSEARTYAAVWH